MTAGDKLRVAIVGYGAVAAIHARQLRDHAQLVSIYGPSLEKAKTFAQEHAIPHATTELESALESCDAAIIASPTPCHVSQATFALDRGIPTIIELPACETLYEAELLSRKSTRIQCAHTARYLEPYCLITSWIRNGTLGEIRQVHYFRCVPQRQKNWADNALLHHAAHPLDLLLDWFGSIEPQGCLTHPLDIPKDVILTGTLPQGGFATIAISYTAKIPVTRMTVIGSKHTIVTDGFSFLDSDMPDFRWQGDQTETYETAIRNQDLAFLQCCRTGTGGIPWSDTLRLMTTLERFRSLNQK